MARSWIDQNDSSGASAPPGEAAPLADMPGKVKAEAAPLA